MTTVRIIGPGRAGRSFAQALAAVGVKVSALLGRDDEIWEAGEGVDLVLLTVPDRAVPVVAGAIRPVASTVVAHCSGVLGLDSLLPHAKVASLHPLVSLPDPHVGARRLRSGCYFATAGDDIACELVAALGGHSLTVAPQAWAAYHAAACVASNHLVALMGQVQRVAATAGVDLGAFLPLARGALEDVALMGPAAALTGPAARGDMATIESHRQALEPSELAGYEAGVALAQRLCGPGSPGDAVEETGPGAKGEALALAGSWSS